MNNIDKNKFKLLLQQIMTEKLQDNVRWNYLYTSEILYYPAKKSAIKRRMKRFINSKKFNEFVNLVWDFAPNFSDEDNCSFGTKTPTENAYKLRNAYNFLIKNGFSGIKKGNKLNFWFGGNAAFIVRDRCKYTNEISDINVPAIAVLFDICNVLERLHKNNTSNHKTLDVSENLAKSISKLYASFANGTVNVFVSPEKYQEDYSLKQDNFFWNAELPILQQRFNEGKIDNIQIHTFSWDMSFIRKHLKEHENYKNLFFSKMQPCIWNNNKGYWNKPINLNSVEADLLKIVRRKAYASKNEKLSDSDPDLFEQSNIRKQEYFTKWVWSKPRKSLRIGQLRVMLKVMLWNTKIKAMRKKADEIHKEKKCAATEYFHLIKKLDELNNVISNYFINSMHCFRQASPTIKNICDINETSEQITNEINELYAKFNLCKVKEAFPQSNF